MYLSIHIKTEVGGLIKHPRILISYYKSADRYPTQKMLNHRGVEQQWLMTRNVSEDEFRTEANQYRVGFITYDDWDCLIEDEKKFVDNPSWFEKIEGLKKKYPQFKKTIQISLEL